MPDDLDQPGRDGRGSRAAQPHDGFFRLVFGSPVHARAAIRALLPELAARLDLNRLTVLNGTFVDAELSRRHSDVCLSTHLDGHEALVYFLLEHQSSPDPLMPWRMLRPVDRLRKVVARLGLDVEEDFMTTADMLRAEGRAETLIQLLTQKFGPLPDSAVAKLHAASTEQLEGWTGRVLSATTLDEIFA